MHLKTQRFTALFKVHTANVMLHSFAVNEYSKVSIVWLLEFEKKIDSSDQILEEIGKN